MRAGFPHRARAARHPADPCRHHGESRRRRDAPVGPWLPEHRIGRANLAAAFPEKSPAEIETILRGVWDNLGRVGAEFAHIDRLWDYDPARRGRGRILDSDETEKIAIRLRDDGKPALIFAAHLANWELAAVGAHAYGIDTTVLYRRPNVPAISDAVIGMRAGCMGTLIPTSMDAPVKLADALQRGSHVAMLVDQYSGAGRAGDVLRPPHPRQCADRAARPPHRLPDPRHPRGALSRRPLPVAA